MQLISAVIITLNEERNITRCLESLVGVADEIVVVDSYSTDGTQRICEEKGVRFVQHAFEGHIEQKNFAITQATYPFVLSLDADEALSDELRDSILRVKNDWNADGYTMNRCTNYCGRWIRHSGWYPDRKLRLWDSRKGAWGGINPHDVFKLHEGSRVEHLKGDLLHYSFASVTEHVQQTDKFTRIMAKALYEKGKKVGVMHLWFKPMIRFFRDYFIYQGFRDGFYGLIICRITAFGVFLKYSRLRQLWRKGEQGTNTL